jgi:exodeoxyribonuclease III
MLWKIITFNVNGIRARLPAVLEWLQDSQPDVLCLQEIKCRTEEFPTDAFQAAGYSAHVRGQKGFHGVAILARRPSGEVLDSFGDGDNDEEARLIAARLDDIWVVNSYVPQGRDPDHPAFQIKLHYFARIRRWLTSRFDPSTPLIWTGDLNVAPGPLDVYDPKRLAGQVGYHPAEHAALADTMAWGFTDLFRKHHPQDKQFTFWDYRLPKSFQRNLGWRIDHIMVTEPLARASLECAVDMVPRGREKPSDHTPVWATFELSGP